VRNVSQFRYAREKKSGKQVSNLPLLMNLPVRYQGADTALDMLLCFCSPHSRDI
jgi:hypothetical protein